MVFLFKNKNILIYKNISETVKMYDCLSLVIDLKYGIYPIYSQYGNIIMVIYDIFDPIVHLGYRHKCFCGPNCSH